MKISTPKPAYAIISQDGSRYTVVYYPKNCTSHEVSGHDYSTILERATSEGLQVIDWRNATFENALKFTNLGNPIEVDKHFGKVTTIAQYFVLAQKHGAS